MAEKHRNILISLCFFAIFVVQFLAMYQNFGIINKEIRSLFVCLATGVIILLSINDKCSILKWNKLESIVFLLVPILLIIAGIGHDIGSHWIYNALVVIFEFTAFYYVWGNRKDFDTLFKMISYAYIGFILLILAYCIIRYPYIDSYVAAKTGYTIMGINPNGFSKLLMPGAASAMYLMIVDNNTIRRLIFGTILGAATCVLFLSESRNAILCMAIILLAGAIIFYRQCKSESMSNDRSIKILLCAVCAIVIGATVMYGTLGFVSPTLAKTFNPDIFEYNEPVETTGVESEEELTYAQTTMRDTCELGQSIVGDNELLIKLNTITSSRVYLWAAYLHNLSWTGTDDVLAQYGPHNIYIEYAYKAGIITGIIWLMFGIIVCIKSLYMAFRYKCSAYYFTLFAFVVYFSSTMLDTGALLLIRSFIFVYFIAVAPVFFKCIDMENKNSISCEKENESE